MRRELSMTRSLVRVPGRPLRDLKWDLTSGTRGSPTGTGGSSAGPTPWTRAGRRGSEAATTKAGDEYQDIVAAVQCALDPGAAVRAGQWIEGPDGRRDLDVEVRG